MTLIKPPHEHLGLTIRKKLGKALHYGRKIYGVPQYGDTEPMSLSKNGEETSPFGIYSMRSIEGKQEIQKKDFYVPYNPRTAEQQAWRSDFADAVASWQSLTNEEKKEYNSKAQGKKMSGYNLYISNYLRSI